MRNGSQAQPFAYAPRECLQERTCELEEKERAEEGET